MIELMSKKYVLYALNVVAFFNLGVSSIIGKFLLHPLDGKLDDHVIVGGSYENSGYLYPT